MGKYAEEGLSRTQNVEYQYDKVFVLLLRWQEDRQSNHPAQDLLKVFRDSYHFDASIITICSYNSLESVLSRLRDIEENLKQKNTLLIVAYIGHGGMSLDKSFSVCAGGIDFPGWLPNPSFEWNKVQEELQKMENDILIIIDACNAAGTIVTADQSISKGRNEVIAACPYNETTPLGFWTPKSISGSRSSAYQPCFTSALIDVLTQKSLLDGTPAFSAVNLHLEITKMIIDRCYTELVLNNSGWLRQPVYYRIGQDLQESSISLKVLKEKDEPQEDSRLQSKKIQEFKKMLANFAKDQSDIDGQELQELFKEHMDLTSGKKK
ncbi:hypothetical protein BKA64DRAFT_740159 [Cadophora sp. MPI-SDFR-AT-0126]|nr:hypothetical protein BKA64DRAFT_740159 [Leotiomycetes sp. MPI-SDFR-AT-0126]